MEIECINTRLLTRGQLKVKIIKVDSPTFFWVHLQNGQEDFEELIEDLTRRMERKARFFHLPPDHILLGEIVTVREGRKWQRGIVTSIARGDKVSVALPDWGRTIQRPMFEIYQLEDRFREQPWRAIPCGLTHIEPVEGRKRWPRRTKELTRILLERQEGWIQIRGSLRDEAAIVTLHLKHESNIELRDVKETLVQIGCAQYSPLRIVAAAPSILD